MKRKYRRFSKAGLCGSLTLEAAIVFPLYLLFFTVLLSIPEMFRMQELLTSVLHDTAKQVAVYENAERFLENPEVTAAELETGETGGEVSGEGVSAVAATVLADAFLWSRLEERIPSSFRTESGVTQDFSVLYSSVMLRGEMVDLVTTYGIEPNGNIFGIPEMKLVCRARTRAWTGYDVNGAGTQQEDGERIVYVTENGTVYHLSLSCTHLDLSITPIPNGTQGSHRNNYGSSYQVCEICGAPALGQETIYITEEGDRYHSSLSCGGLRRTIYEVPISQVGDMRMCSRCAGRMGSD